MALETLKGIDLGEYIIVDHKFNEITFRIQNGSIGEVGRNGSQVDDMVKVAINIIEGLDNKFSCSYNKKAIGHLVMALGYLEERKEDRERRGVEGRESR